MENQKDNINPDHYKNQSSLECIESMRIIFGKDVVTDFCICNAWKYIWRWKNKNGQEDLKKANWYINYAHNIINSDDKKNGLLRRMMYYVSDTIEPEDNDERK